MVKFSNKGDVRNRKDLHIKVKNNPVNFAAETRALTRSVTAGNRGSD